MCLSLFAFCAIGIVACENVNIGAVFEGDEGVEAAFKFAVKNLNDDNPDAEFTFDPLVYDNFADGDQFVLMRNVCSIIDEGVVAIFGPRSYRNIDVVQSICDVKEIPHIITRWKSYYIDGDKTIVNFYPDSSTLSRAYYDIITNMGWKTFTVLYEGDESLLRIKSLVETAHQDGVVTQMMQLDPFYTGNFRDTMRDLKKTQQKSVVIDCHIDSLFQVLTQLQQAGLMNEQYSYFITNLDTHTENLMPFKYSNANITGIRLVNPDSEYVQKVSSDLLSENLNFLESPAWKIRLEQALTIDAVNMLAAVVIDRQKSSDVRIITNKNSLLCAEPDSWEHGLSIVNLLKSYPHDGLTGRVIFDNQGYRSDLILTIFELLEGGITDVGVWSSSYGLNASRPGDVSGIDDPESMRNKSFVVEIALTEPYGMLKQTTDHLYGNDMYEGYAIDLIEKLAEMEGFNYTFVVREDKSSGSFDKKTQKWGGMIGDLLDKKADLAICDFTITSDREGAVDFTVPFMSLGISILFREPESAPPSFFSFADPFALDSWMLLGVSFVTVSLCFYFTGRICSDEWTNPFPCIEEPEYLVNQFSLSNSFWFATGALLAQGSEIAPIAISTRMASGIWWYFCLIMSASYTANLAAFLATENPIKLFTDLQSLYDSQDITYGAKVNGATFNYFTTAKEGLLQKVGKVLLDHPEYNVLDNDIGVQRAEDGKYAFFMESSSIEYVTQRHCNLMQYGDHLDEKGYGIAMRKYSPYRKKLSLALLKLQQNHFLDDLKKKWWEERRGGGACEGVVESSEADPLELVNVEGCFYMTVFGTILAFGLVLIEHFLYLLRVRRRSGIPFWKIIKAELKAYINFNSPSKPNLEVLKKIPDEAEAEDDKKSEDDKEDSEENRRKSKSASQTRTFTRSRSKSVSRQTSHSRKKRSKSSGKRTPLSYGFIIPSSLENLKDIEETF
ncbi:unnamed protein product [Phyllotreta striolata]|uniref:Uncharacterized protein n=1 Tax=Phyllotreta striolata TaxID=444603 RepID=A0A9N9TPH1_PHYSR|nr:unnamed protein product [Phyllotreta striolata]